MKNKSFMVVLILLTIAVMFSTSCSSGKNTHAPLSDILRDDTLESESLQRPYLVPVKDNKALIRGRILDVGTILHSSSSSQVERKIFKYKLVIQASYDIEGFKNYAKEKVGQELTVYSSEFPSSEILNSDEIEAHIIYWREERRSSFWIQNIKVVK